LNQTIYLTATNPTISLGRSAGDMARDVIAQLKPQGPSIRGGGPQRIGVHNVLFRISAGDAGHGCQ
jgi:hypothetical protein